VNQALAFGLLLAGGVALEAGLTGKGPAAVLKGTAGPIPTTGSTLNVTATTGAAATGAGAAVTGAAGGAAKAATGISNGVGGVGSTIANAVGGLLGGTAQTGTAVGSVTYADLQTLATAHGWDAAEIADWVKVITAESNGSLTAQNPSSPAYGIAQFISGASEYATYGGNSTTVIGQLTTMANYISQRYGSPSAAWAHEQSDGNY